MKLTYVFPRRHLGINLDSLFPSPPSLPPVHRQPVHPSNAFLSIFHQCQPRPPSSLWILKCPQTGVMTIMTLQTIYNNSPALHHWMPQDLGPCLSLSGLLWAVPPLLSTFQPPQSSLTCQNLSHFSIFLHLSPLPGAHSFLSSHTGSFLSFSSWLKYHPLKFFQPIVILKMFLPLLSISDT